MVLILYAIGTVIAITLNFFSDQQKITTSNMIMFFLLSAGFLVLWNTINKFKEVQKRINNEKFNKKD